jgi:hypothetical protein
LDGRAAHFIERWVQDHIGRLPNASTDDDARAREFSRWLRKDAANSGLSDEQIDSAISTMVGAGHGLVAYICDAMSSTTDLAASSPHASRLADEDI